MQEYLNGEDIDMEKKRRVHGFALRIVIYAVIITSSAAFGNQSDSQAEQPIKYELKLEGENIEKLILQSSNQEQTFEKPGKSIMLEPGTYKIVQLQLDSKLIHDSYGDNTQLKPIQVGPGEPAVLKAGGPLEQQIKVQREGQLLTMEYQLIGAAGESYRNDRRYPPKFVIYKGDKEITSGKFRFG
ncbi:MAG: hypothetical protein A2168_08030 [Planctomycetes bacterium RBG_13_50_24]|nr:MAG: hypothetical protein A2168_08030 [Planctomycetes bacterium RBG_13_50_24]